MFFESIYSIECGALVFPRRRWQVSVSSPPFSFHSQRLSGWKTMFWDSRRYLKTQEAPFPVFRPIPDHSWINILLLVLQNMVVMKKIVMLSLFFILLHDFLEYLILMSITSFCGQIFFCNDCTRLTISRATCFLLSCASFISCITLCSLLLTK